jgi:putative ABC transport system ATP-binding protein
MLAVRGAVMTFHSGTPNEVRALQGVDLTIDKGAFVIVVGTNGSGKSTLLNAVAGSFFLDEGSIHLAGRDVTRWPEHRRAQLIGRVFQEPVQRHRARHVDRREHRARRAAGTTARPRLGAAPRVRDRDARARAPPRHGPGGSPRQRDRARCRAGSARH